jgi:dipeptidase E
VLDLKNYFNKKEDLENKLKELGAVFVSGGNTFVLRQAMKLSGLDRILQEFKDSNIDFLYASYSAGSCVLSPTLKAYAIVDNSKDNPYQELKEVIWEGLGFIDFVFMPHFDSDHPESEAINQEIEFCKQNNIPYKAFRDGDVFIF